MGIGIPPVSRGVITCPTSGVSPEILEDLRATVQEDGTPDHPVDIYVHDVECAEGGDPFHPIILQTPMQEIVVE
jgi:hypothetical protein